MNEAELREQISRKIYLYWGNPYSTWNTCGVRGLYRERADRILNLIKEAGYLPLEQVEKDTFRKVRQALRGEPVVWHYALDGAEIDWLYQITKKVNEEK